MLFSYRYGIDKLIDEVRAMVMTIKIELPCGHKQVVTKAHLGCSVISCLKCKKISRLTAKLKRKIADDLKVEKWKNHSPMR